MIKRTTKQPWFRRLLANSRFWILAIAVVAAINIAGFIQLEIPGGSLQIIRVEQAYGFVSLLLLYLAIVISPLTKVFVKLPGKDEIVHARRAIGVSAFFFALLHTCITFFGQLDGFSGIEFLSFIFLISLIFGAFSLGVLAIMTVTSFDWVVDHMGYKHWKLLHRLVYLASIALLAHVFLIGPHYDNRLTSIGVVTYIAAGFLIVLEALRIRQNRINKKRPRHD